MNEVIWIVLLRLFCRFVTVNFSQLLTTIDSAPNRGIKYAYGTAGFRLPNAHGELDCAVLRSSLLACLRSRACNGAAVGIMITASHNAEPDNGTKLCDPDGEMLAASWEPYAVELANATSSAAVVAILERIAATHAIDVNAPALVYVAYDTRVSSLSLRDIVLRGVAAYGGQSMDFGLLTTPQLHHVVLARNANERFDEEGYYIKLANGFRNLLPVEMQSSSTSLLTIQVDCACGVGAPALARLANHVAPLLDLRVINGVGDGGALNDGCGAEHVQKSLQLPRGVKPGDRGCFASLDGDADRIVFFGAERGLALCDGDKIAALVARAVKNLLEELCIDARVGVVQTAYANGAATAFVRDVLRLPVSFVKTGVKYLHHKAKEFDVGVYFEANGHGTVLFADSFLARLPASTARTRLLAMADVAHQAVGDALGDLLLVAGLLVPLMRESASLDAIAAWNALYVDLYSRQGKVKVRDRSAIKTSDDETRALAPTGLQAAIDAVVAQRGVAARAFVRPSGTEDIVRTYAECDSRDAVDALERDVADCVHRLAGGV